MLRRRGVERSKRSRHSRALHKLRSALAFPTCMVEVCVTLFLSLTLRLLRGDIFGGLETSTCIDDVVHADKGLDMKPASQRLCLQSICRA